VGSQRASSGRTGNLKVADSEYAYLAERYIDYSEKMEKAFQSYINILNNVCQNAISDGAVFDNLQAFRDTAQRLSGQFSAIAKGTAEIYSDFKNDIDAADEYLY
jgi:hypothetical protein